MDITERIKDNFNRGYFGKSMIISELPSEYPAWTIKQDDSIGVAIPMDNYKPFSEQFSTVHIQSAKNVFIGNIQHDILMLTSTDMASRNEFAYVCSDFVAPGKNGENRKSIVSNPTDWWKNWKTLIGNISSDKTVYDTLGELLTVEKLLLAGAHPIWAGPSYATHDVEADDFSVEVKTTNQRYRYEVTISSIYQLLPAEHKDLFFYYLRVEPSATGRSIDDVAESLKSLGYDAIDLEDRLAGKQLEKGRPAREEKYKIIEWKRYAVDNSFPAITESSFAENCFPPHVVRFTYTIDLSGLSGENIL